MQNLSHKSIYNLYKSCSTLLQETKKIGFTFYDFSVNFYAFYKIQAPHKRKEEYFALGSSEPSDFHNSTLNSNNQAPRGSFFTNLPSDGGACSPAVGPGRGNTRHQSVIGLTRDRLTVLGRPVTSPVSGDGGAVAARPRGFRFRRGEEPG
jgi:hypothetical protein